LAGTWAAKTFDPTLNIIVVVAAVAALADIVARERERVVIYYNKYIHIQFLYIFKSKNAKNKNNIKKLRPLHQKVA
jgi:hypothetical protein